MRGIAQDVILRRAVRGVTVELDVLAASTDVKAVTVIDIVGLTVDGYLAAATNVDDADLAAGPRSSPAGLTFPRPWSVHS